MQKSIRVVAVSGLALCAALLASVPASAAERAATLELMGKSDLGGKGLNGEVATVGDTAIVAAGQRQGAGAFTGFSSTVPCPRVSVKVVDLSTPSEPRVTNKIDLPEGVAAIDVAAMKMDTPSFSGNLAAVALARCQFGPGNNAERGVAYYDVTNPREPELLGRYMADSDQVQETDRECDGQAPATRRCAQSQHAVSLVKRPDGKVLSLSTQPFAAGSNFKSGDLRIVDITNPRTPTQVGDWPEQPENSTSAYGPPGYDPDGPGPQPGNPPAFSNNGCRPFDMGRAATGTGDGTKALFAYWDRGLFSLDISDPSKPGLLGNWSYDRDDRSREGNAAYVESTTVGGRSLALMSDEDWIAPVTSLRIDGSGPLAGSKFACEAMFTLFDPENDAAIYKKPNSEVPGEMAYVGRGCPQGGNVTTEDPYLQDPNGKIIVVDATTQVSRQGVLPGGAVGCLAAAKVKRAQEAGAKGMVVLRTSTSIPQAVSFDGKAEGLNIPVVQIDTGDSTALRDAICPAPATSGTGCGEGGQTVSGAMVDKMGAWGGLHVLDTTNPARPNHLSEYHTPAARELPPDRGVYSIHHAIGGQGGLAYAAWNSAGLRVLDLEGGNPQEIASFVPEDTPDPSQDDANSIPATVPPKAFVVGVAETEKGQIVISDINSGLYVLSLRDDSCSAGTSEGVTCKGLPGGGRQSTGTAGNDTIVGTANDDVIVAGDGDDVVVAQGGNDAVNAGAGNDRVSGGEGNDRISGSTGNDYLVGASGDDLVAGNEGTDRISGDVGNDVLVGNEDNDFITGEAGNDYISGGIGNDRLSGGSGADRIRGDDGNDVITGDDGNDFLTGEAGDDRLYGGPGLDRLNGGSGRNVVRQ